VRQGAAQGSPGCRRWEEVPSAVLARLLPVPRREPVATPDHDRRDGDPPELTPRSSLEEIGAALPGLRAELGDRARVAGLMVAWVGLLAMPAWTLVDRIVIPAQADAFWVARLLCEIPIAVGLALLWWHPVGRSRSELVTFGVLASVQTCIAWMTVVADERQYHLLGFTLAIYGSGCILVARPRWTVALVGWTWLSLGGSMALYPGRMPAEDLVAATVFLGTASVIATLAHLRRYALNNRELVTRVRLEREQQRTGVLLDRLERLSHEDPLTGLANRRRWDAELGSVCADARRRGIGVAVILVDIDHFKRVNDRHGHAGGDETLRAVATLLADRVRGEDLVARLGGDEIGVLLPGAALPQAVELAERLRTEALRLHPAGLTEGELSVSLGVAAVAGEQAYPLELMSRADEQLYRAKITRNAVGAPRRVPLG
jgi:diguanylate cyclase (GGDEF)-like protein